MSSKYAISGNFISVATARLYPSYSDEYSAANAACMSATIVTGIVMLPSGAANVKLIVQQVNGEFIFVRSEYSVKSTHPLVQEALAVCSFFLTKTIHALIRTRR